MPLSTLSGLREEVGTRTAASTITANNKPNKVASYMRAETDKLFSLEQLQPFKISPRICKI